MTGIVFNCAIQISEEISNSCKIFPASYYIIAQYWLIYQQLIMSSSQPAAAASASKSSKKRLGKTDKNLNDAAWFGSKAKDIMAQDFIDEILPLEGPINSKDVYDALYADHPDFADFPYDKTLYDGRFQRIQMAVRKQKDFAILDEAALRKDRNVYPIRSHNAKGEPNWRGSEAEYWLKVDMDAGKHLEMKPGELFATRECYQPFGKKRFRDRIDQLKEKAKPYGTTPGQSKKLGDPEKSRLKGNNSDE